MPDAAVCAVVASVGRPGVVGDVLRSIVGQSAPVSEVLLVTPDVADVPDLAGFSGRVRHVLSPRGLTAQRNAGIRAAAAGTEYFLFVDDDSVLHERYVETAVGFLAGSAGHVALTGGLLRDGAAERREISAGDAADALARLAVDGLGAPRPTDALYGCNFVVRADVARAELFDEALPLYGWLEDLDFARRAARHGALAHHPGAAAVHRGVGSGGRTAHYRFGYSQIANPLHLRRKRLISRAELAVMLVKTLPYNGVRSVGAQGEWRRTRVLGNLRALDDLTRRRLRPGRVVELDR